MKHSFPVKAILKRTITLTYQFNPTNYSIKLPAGCFLELKNERAFLILAFVETEKMRPAFIPALIGRNFNLLGIRVIVNWYDENKRLKRGLYVLKSITDSRLMAKMGNMMTGYHFEYSPITWNFNKNECCIEVQNLVFKVDLSDYKEEIGLPKESVFLNWKEARKYAGPMKYTCVHSKTVDEMLIVEGVKESWIPRPIKLISGNWDKLNSIFKELKLCAVFEIKEIPYHWKKGRIVQMNKK